MGLFNGIVDFSCVDSVCGLKRGESNGDHRSTMDMATAPAHLRDLGLAIPISSKLLTYNNDQ